MTSNPTSQLFMFYLGGKAPGANIEVHDVQFVASETPEAAYPQLAERWFGVPETLHIDTYSRVTWADGYDVFLSDEPSTSEHKLWFINMGGYREGLVTELHACDLFVAASEGEAKTRAKEILLTGAILQHRDDQIDVDDCFRLAEIQGLHVHLTPNPAGTNEGQPEFQGFVAIGRNLRAWDVKNDKLVNPDEERNGSESPVFRRFGVERRTETR